MITSRSNPIIKKYRKISSKLPSTERKVVIEGLRLFSEALKSGVSFEALFFTPRWLESSQTKSLLGPMQSRVPVFEAVSSEVMESLSLEETPSGLWALIEIGEHAPVAAVDRILVLCGVQDPGNAGTLIRCAEGAQASVWFSENSVHPFHPKVVKASMGSAFRLPVNRGPVLPFLARLKQEKRILVGTRSSGGVRYDQWNWTAPFALLLGNEAEGIPEEVHRMVDADVSIPLQGEVESLNVAAAGAVLLFEACRQQPAG